MTSLIEWFFEYPSRIIACEWFIIGILMCILANVKKRNKPHTNKRRFVYCENGRKSNIASVELVSQYEFDNYTLFVDYPIIDMNNTSIYFALPNDR